MSNWTFESHHTTKISIWMTIIEFLIIQDNNNPLDKYLPYQRWKTFPFQTPFCDITLDFTGWLKSVIVAADEMRGCVQWKKWKILMVKKLLEVFLIANEFINGSCQRWFSNSTNQWNVLEELLITSIFIETSYISMFQKHQSI